MLNRIMEAIIPRQLLCETRESEDLTEAWYVFVLSWLFFILSRKRRRRRRRSSHHLKPRTMKSQITLYKTGLGVLAELSIVSREWERGACHICA